MNNKRKVLYTVAVTVLTLLAAMGISFGIFLLPPVPRLIALITICAIAYGFSLRSFWRSL